jgi:hypothetical protein
LPPGRSFLVNREVICPLLRSPVTAGEQESSEQYQPFTVVFPLGKLLWRDYSADDCTIATPRRRAQARNEARQQNRHSELSRAQLAANRANAERSAGPVTAEGKTRSSKNALPTDDADRYQAHVETYAARQEVSKRARSTFHVGRHSTARHA